MQVIFLPVSRPRARPPVRTTFSLVPSVVTGMGCRISPLNVGVFVQIGIPNFSKRWGAGVRRQVNPPPCDEVYPGPGRVMEILPHPLGQRRILAVKLPLLLGFKYTRRPQIQHANRVPRLGPSRPGSFRSAGPRMKLIVFFFAISHVPLSLNGYPQPPRCRFVLYIRAGRHPLAATDVFLAWSIFSSIFPAYSGMLGSRSRPP